MDRRIIACVYSFVLILFASTAFGDDADTSESDDSAGLSYRLIGPAAGGRVSRVTGVPGEELTYYAATAAGGVWKTEDGGLVWKSIFDDQPVSSTGSVVVAPSAPNVVYVGSGEANIRGNVGEGNGIYRSTDSGATWKHVWNQEGQIGSMAVHPRSPDIAYAAVLGSPFGPGPERGVFRTRDGGETWDKILFVDADTGASDVTLDPNNPSVVYAGMWQTRRTPWGMTSGGPGSGLYVSRDGGDNWKKLTGEGLPDGIWGRVGVRVAPSDSRRVYAIIEAEEGGLFRSDDSGATWKRISDSRGLRQRAWYYSTLTVNPSNPDIVWFPQVGMLKTIDGGREVRAATGGGWDYHDVWIDPDDTRRMVVASDAGVSLTRDGGETWVRPPLPISQFYHLSVDTSTPYRVLGSLQDWGTTSGPSNSLHNGGILLTDWSYVGGGEAGHVVAEPGNPGIVWAGEYLGFISRFDETTGLAPHVGIYPENGSGHGAKDLEFRFQWTAPIVISPHDPKTVYHASNILFRTRDGGQSWTAISPDLTRDDETKQGWAGGPITGDNTGVEYYGTIFAVAESPVTSGVIWAGTDDGLVHLTRDGGENWTDVTPSKMPQWATVSAIEASRRDAGTAYLVADAHRLDDETPYLWKTTDFGKNWKSLTGALDPEIYLHVVREDTRTPGLLFLGTERGVMVSHDDGGSWESLRLNMPTVSVVELVVAGDDLVVGTLGRSAWIMDDLTPVREMNSQFEQAATRLFAPLSTVRWHYRAAPGAYSDPDRDGAGANPPKGASITYNLGSEPSGEIQLAVVDAEGSDIRLLRSVVEPQYTAPDHPDWDPDSSEPEPALSKEIGLNRASWNLRYSGAEKIPGARYDTYDPGDGPLVRPGDYTLRLTVDGKAFEQPLEVLQDPRSSASPADLAAQTAFMLEVRDRMTQIADMVETIGSLRAQVEEANQRLAARPAMQDLVESGRAIMTKLDSIETRLYNPGAEVDYDILAGREGGAMLYSRYGWLANSSGDHEGPPTQGMRQVANTLGAELRAQFEALQAVQSGDISALNALAAERGVPYVQ